MSNTGATKLAGLTFAMQIGLVRETFDVERGQMTLAHMKDIACAFVDRKYPEHGLYGLQNRILLFRHDSSDPNILKLVTSSSEIMENMLVEVVLSAQTTADELLVRPHALKIHSYTGPHFCDFCGEELMGISKQGLKCQACGLNIHKACAYKIPNNCSSARRHSMAGYGGLLSANNGTLKPDRNSRSNSLTTGLFGLSVEVPHSFVIHSYELTRLPKCCYCKTRLKFYSRQGLQCQDCKRNCHKKCAPLVPNDCPGKILTAIVNNDAGEDEVSISSDMSDCVCDSDPETEDGEGDISAAVSTLRSLNIPLQRVVQSVKHTKHSATQVQRQGWMVHHTNLDTTPRRHYWKLDTRSLTLYQNDHTSRYYKEIKLQDIVQICKAPMLPSSDGQHPYVFEIHLANIVYHVGEDPTCGDSEKIIVRSVESGVGLEQALSWENALRQALMPLTPTITITQADSKSADEGTPGKAEIMDISKLYKINPADILGAGQFGTVYGARDLVTNKDVAIKVIDKRRFPTKQEKQLDMEVAILQALNHPGVVNLQKRYEAPEKIYVVMEKLEGDMLEMIMNSRQGRLTERVTKYLFSQILSALDYLHTNSVVHCDLKPENVLLSSETPFPQVKLCDFGFARIIGEKSFRRSIVGTPAYLAPEVLKKQGFNRKLDMWALGVIVYVSLSGTFPFNEDEEISDQIHNAAFMYPDDPWEEVSEAAKDLINNLLQVTMMKRFTIPKCRLHKWLQDYQCWADLRQMETIVGQRYLTDPSHDASWLTYGKERLFPPWKNLGHKNVTENERVKFPRLKRMISDTRL